MLTEIHPKLPMRNKFATQDFYTNIRWQVLPKNLGALLSKPNAFTFRMRQTKIIIEDYLK